MQQYVIITLIGCLLGRLAAGWAASMLADMNSGGLVTCPQCKAHVSITKRWFSLVPVRCSCERSSAVTWHILSSVGLGGLFLSFSWLLLAPATTCQGVHEVRPDQALLVSRLPFHLTLIFLLWVATLTDLLDYVIPDEVIYPGILIAILASFVSGELQMIHIWVNWDESVVSLEGPYLPDWMKNHHHLHGIAWSLAGMATGASVTWLVRWLSEFILRYPALGLGDVTLMAMVGSFIGWQPTLCVLAVAPLLGIVVGFFVRLITGRTFVAFGPYLACSAVFVICTWRWLWADFLSLRDIFSHWPSVAGLIGLAFVALVILLGLVRVIRTVPIENLKR